VKPPGNTLAAKKKKKSRRRRKTIAPFYRKNNAMVRDLLIEYIEKNKTS